MSDRRYAVMFLRLGFLASALFAVFWGAWHLSGHRVPAYSSLKLTENMFLDFPISRWWDILFAFLFVNMYAWISRVYYKFGLKFAEKEDLIVGFGVSLIVGLIFGLGVGLITSLGVGLIFGLGVGLGVGLITSLGVGLIFGLGDGLLHVLFSPNFWKAIYNWFVAKNIA